MKIYMAILKQDIKFQIRHGFYLAYFVVTMMYIGLLSFLPEQAKPMAVVLIVFSDPVALGYFFIGGIILLEKGQTIFDSLFVTPLQIRDYIYSKVSSLGLLSVISSLAIHVTIFGISHVTVLFILGVFLTSVFFTLIGIGVAVRCQTVNGFFLISPLYAIVFCFPLLGYLDIFHSPLYNLLPTQTSLYMIEPPFTSVFTSASISVEMWSFIPQLLILIGWIVLAYMWAIYSFHKYIILKMGG